ncbi:hypothetical protein CLUG_05078 [Clavispora lusitaniae ATCC 42720]|uniref:Uncharacterized protein n=1 Tax=Clavispora lusitaniae (strain ATCC 42720) TaxID=306902 RepID=C4YAE0_CLAL4|nr:uncharacterized protein CLUG_05078 [Clavispora lusitaniae ATCC 42720]EEQ40950.1 hypothetical protein CLUG_05078 [Clavispora lusitaniae ATCC 42720]
MNAVDPYSSSSESMIRRLLRLSSSSYLAAPAAFTLCNLSAPRSKASSNASSSSSISGSSSSLATKSSSSSYSSPYVRSNRSYADSFRPGAGLSVSPNFSSCKRRFCSIWRRSLRSRRSCSSAARCFSIGSASVSVFKILSFFWMFFTACVNWRWVAVPVDAGSTSAVLVKMESFCNTSWSTWSRARKLSAKGKARKSKSSLPTFNDNRPSSHCTKWALDCFTISSLPALVYRQRRVFWFKSFSAITSFSMALASMALACRSRAFSATFALNSFGSNGWAST